MNSNVRLLLLASVLALAIAQEADAQEQGGDALLLSREAAFQHAVDLYRAHPGVKDWRARVTIDRRLSKGAGGLPVARLEELLRKSPNDLAVATAVAICVGDGLPTDPVKQTVKVFEELLASPYDRVRYRAAESIIQRLAEGSLDQTGSELLRPAVDAAITRETSELNQNSLKYAKYLLSDPAPIWLGK